MGDAKIPHLAIPFSVDPDGTVAVVQQDSEEEIIQCVSVLLATTLGRRPELPEYGVEDPTFTTTARPDMLINAAHRWEPRAFISIDPTIDPLDELTRIYNIKAARA